MRCSKKLTVLSSRRNTLQKTQLRTEMFIGVPGVVKTFVYNNEDITSRGMDFILLPQELKIKLFFIIFGKLIPLFSSLYSIVVDTNKSSI
jgi:hypothetical protein